MHFHETKEVDKANSRLTHGGVAGRGPRMLQVVLRKVAKLAVMQVGDFHPVCKGCGEQQPHSSERRCKTSLNQQ